MSNWIEHDGSRCPVPVGTLVEIRRRGLRETVCRCTGGVLAWTWDYHGKDYQEYDIIAYRIVEPLGPFDHAYHDR